MDEFASKLAGKIERLTLPQRGQWIRQGQKIWSLHRDGATVDMVSPIEGSVADINEAAVRDPELARKDPFGEGWLVTVQSLHAKTNFRNLLGGALARWWTEESASRLQRRMPMALGALAQVRRRSHGQPGGADSRQGLGRPRKGILPVVSGPRMGHSLPPDESKLRPCKTN